MADPLRVARTRILRSPATGPEPCNTLAFLRCNVPGLDVPLANDEVARHTVRFQTEFRLDGYVQSEYQWYLDNTHVSATASLRFLNTTTDLQFLMAVDTVTPELQQLDGTLTFHVGLAAYMQDDAWFGGGDELVLTASLTAYVLCFEPRAERPPSGRQRTPWAQMIAEGPRISDMLARRAKYITARAAAQAARVKGCPPA
ncbi:MAG TPA: hypothetical protein VMW48_09100 [Vicinamibacterales bacterium]|nr:hypothetical protein [Vicinamibacterales bacterium]